jgi:predicted dinucleotide-binding enzyme
MRIGILGTGIVGRTLATALAAQGHDVAIGTRNVDALMARTDPDQMGNPPFSVWHADHANIGVAVFADAAAHGELLVNAAHGDACIDALTAAGAENLDGKVLIDPSNALDFSQGFPPFLFVSNTDSLAEQIQRAFPQVKVVKALNTMTAALMVDPAALAGGDHTVFVCGNDEAAKTQVTGLLRDAFGWRDILDLGDITNARATEGYLLMWTRTMPAVGTELFNIKVVK